MPSTPTSSRSAPKTALFHPKITPSPPFPPIIPPIFSSFLFPFQFRNFKIIYRRYAGLYFCICVDVTDNNLAYLEAIHNFVEVGFNEPESSLIGRHVN